MRYLKKALWLTVALMILIPCFGGFASAQGEDWLFIDGENITRNIDMAVIYNQGASTGQTQWGHNAVIDENNKVVSVIESGDAEGENLAIPQGGAVISATGVKAEWLKNNVSLGDILYYDRYTQRLFVCDGNGGFDPYFSKEFIIEDFQSGGYAVSEENGLGKTDYLYGISIDAGGTVVERGGMLNHYEGGAAIYATTAESRNELIMYAPIGAHCDIADGMATITYESDMLDESLVLALAEAEAWLTVAGSEYDYVDSEAIEAIITEAKELSEGSLDYKTAFNMIYRLENQVKLLCSETEITELRGAFHTPDETTDTEVRATVLSAKASGLNSLILRVSNGYGSFIPLPEGNRFTQDAKFGGFDVLQSYIDICRQEGIALTLCIDVYYNQYASVAAPEWLSAPNGESEGLSNRYYSPASEEFKNYFLEYVKHIVTNYDIDSLMFDYLRYPKFTESGDLGYDYDCLERFSKEYEIPAVEVEAIKTELFNSPHWKKWVEFRTGLVNSMASALSQTVRDIRSDITLLAVAERDTVDYFYMQDSLNWIKDKLFDGICVAFFEADSDEGDPLGDNAYYSDIVADKGQTFASYSGDSAYFFAGLESGSSVGGNLLNESAKAAREIGADGFIFSSLEAFNSQNYSSVLGEGVLRGTAVSPLGDTQANIKAILNFTKNKIYDHIRVSGGCEEETAISALEKIDAALASLQESPMSLEQAEDLESDMAMLFASSPAKASALEEFQAIVKLTKLMKEESEISFPEPGDESQTEESQSDKSEITEESGGSEDITAPEASQNSSETLNNIAPEEKGVDIGSILIYGFVGITAVAVIAAMIVGIKRKNNIAPDHHMPKGSAKGYEDKE